MVFKCFKRFKKVTFYNICKILKWNVRFVFECPDVTFSERQDNVFEHLSVGKQPTLVDQCDHSNAAMHVHMFSFQQYNT